MRAGFQFAETMEGTWRALAGEAERAMKFSIAVRAPSVLGHVWDGKALLDGKVDMEGFATGQSLSGEIKIAPLLGRIIRYEFEFLGDDGQRYRFRGQKDINFRNLLHSWTTLPGEIVDAAEKLIGRANLKFELAGLGKFLRSFRRGF